jgi:hypothetical protein
MSTINKDASAPKVPYRSGTYAVPNGSNNLGLLAQIFGKIVPDIFGFNQKLIDFTLGYDGEITVRFNSPTNDPFILLIPHLLQYTSILEICWDPQGCR